MSVYLDDYTRVSDDLRTLADEWLDPHGTTYAMLAFSKGQPADCDTLLTELQAAIKDAGRTEARGDVPKLREIENMARNRLRLDRVRQRLDSALFMAVDCEADLGALHRWLDESWHRHSKAPTSPVGGSEPVKAPKAEMEAEPAQEAA